MNEDKKFENKLVKIITAIGSVFLVSAIINLASNSDQPNPAQDYERHIICYQMNSDTYNNDMNELKENIIKAKHDLDNAVEGTEDYDMKLGQYEFAKKHPGIVKKSAQNCVKKIRIYEYRNDVEPYDIPDENEVLSWKLDDVEITSNLTAKEEKDFQEYLDNKTK